MTRPLSRQPGGKTKGSAVTTLRPVQATNQPAASTSSLQPQYLVLGGAVVAICAVVLLGTADSPRPAPKAADTGWFGFGSGSANPAEVAWSPVAAVPEAVAEPIKGCVEGATKAALTAAVPAAELAVTGVLSPVSAAVVTTATGLGCVFSVAGKSVGDGTDWMMRNLPPVVHRLFRSGSDA